MQSEIIRFDVKEVEQAAREDFVRAAGFEPGNKKHQRMAGHAEETLEKTLQYIKPTAVVSAFGPEVFKGDEVVLDGIHFQCNAFARVEPGKVKQLYTYILTAGEIPIDEENAMDMLFGDMWGTAFTDGALDVLKEHLKKQAGYGDEVVGSTAFGPGFYGMELTTIPQFFELMDGEKIGVTVRDNSFMLPLKSCAGFIVLAEDLSAFPPSDCENCIGGKSGCNFCKNNPKALAGAM